MVGHLGAVDPTGEQELAVLVDLLGRDVEGDVVHGADGAGELALIGPPPRGTDTRDAVGGVGEPEEGEAVTAPAVEEEVLAHAGRQLDRLHQWHAEHVRVEVHRALHVPADQGEVVDPAELEWTACPVSHVSVPSL